MDINPIEFFCITQTTNMTSLVYYKNRESVVT